MAGWKDIGSLATAMDWLIFSINQSMCSYNCMIEIGFSWRGKNYFLPIQHLSTQYECYLEREIKVTRALNQHIRMIVIIDDVTLKTGIMYMHKNLADPKGNAWLHNTYITHKSHGLFYGDFVSISKLNISRSCSLSFYGKEQPGQSEN